MTCRKMVRNQLMSEKTTYHQNNCIKETFNQDESLQKRLHQKSNGSEVNLLTKNTKTVSKKVIEKPYFERTQMSQDKKKYIQSKLRKPP